MRKKNLTARYGTGKRRIVRHDHCLRLSARGHHSACRTLVTAGAIALFQPYKLSSDLQLDSYQPQEESLVAWRDEEPEKKLIPEKPTEEVEPGVTEKETDLISDLRKISKQRVQKKRAKEAEEDEFNDEIPEGEDPSEYRVRLPNMITTEVTDKLTEKWDVEKLFGLDKEFGSLQFYDQLLTLEEEYAEFKKKYLTGSTGKLVNNFTEAIQEFDKMHEPIKRMAAFHEANVHLINSAGQTVSWEAKEMFEKFRGLHTKTFPTVLEDFKQLIRAMPISEFKTLSELPIAKKYLPYLRGLKADFSTKVNPQVTAMTFSSAAADHETPIEVHGHKLTLKMVEEALKMTGGHLPEYILEAIETSPNKDELLSLFIKRHRWNAFIYSYNPGSLSLPQDRYAYINQKLSISAEAKDAMLKAVETVGNPLWERYLAITQQILREANYIKEDNKIPYDLLLVRPPVFPLPRKDKVMTWQEQHAALIEGTNDLSPKIAENVKELDKNGRILWEKLHDEKDNEAVHSPRMSPGGFDVKPIIKMTYQPQYPANLCHGGALYFKAGAYVEQLPTNLMPKCRNYFLKSINRIGLDYFLQKYQMDSESKMDVLSNRTRFLFHNLGSIKMASSFDKFEKGFHDLCDKLGQARQTKVKIDSPMPSVEDVKNLWEDCLKDLSAGGNYVDAKSERNPVTTSLLNLGEGIRGYAGPFKMNRQNYKTLVSQLTYLAVLDGIYNTDGTMKPVDKREEVFREILKATPNMNFDDYITKIGGNAQDSAYWERILKDAFEKKIEECETILKHFKENPDENRLNPLTALIKQFEAAGGPKGQETEDNKVDDVAK